MDSLDQIQERVSARLRHWLGRFAPWHILVAGLALTALTAALVLDRSGRVGALPSMLVSVELSASVLLYLWGRTQLSHLSGVKGMAAETAARLAEASALFQLITRNVDDLIVVGDAAGKVLFTSPSHERVLGYPASTAAPASLTEHVHVDDLAKLAEARSAVLQADEAAVAEVRVRHRDGHWRTFECKISSSRDQAGEIRLLTMARDITERHEAWQALRRSHGESESLLAAISAVLIGVDARGQIARWNRVAEQMFGIPTADAIGRTFFNCGIRWDWNQVRKATLDCLVLHRAVELDNMVCQRPGAAEVSLSLLFSPTPDGPPGGLQFILLATDITQRRIMESQLRQSQKLESIGQLAAGIAHEINTPTQFIGGNLRFVRDSFETLAGFIRSAHALTLSEAAPDPAEIVTLRQAAAAADLDYLLGELPKALDESLEGVDRVARIVHAMKVFSHPGTAEMVMVNLNRAIESTVTVARNEWKYVAELELKLDPALPAVPCHPGDINQVILNLVVNAAHAIADTDRVKQGGKGVILVSTHSEDGWVEIRISDSGTGIPEAIQQRIFDPFFTTKEVGRGTGQGLFVCHKVVAEKHRGQIRFETEMGAGTTFIVRLPLLLPVALKEAA